jgi:tyrosine decarboxylase
VHADDRFEVVVPRNFALVCFKIKANGGMTEEEADEANRALVDNLNKTGKAYLAQTVVGDRFVLRHVRSACELIKKTTSEILD